MFNNTLEDLRAQMVQQLALITMVFIALAMHLTLTQDPYPYDLMVLLSSIFGLGWIVQNYAIQYPILTRHGFIWGLCLSLLVSMMMIENPWLPILGLLLVMISTFLLSRSGAITAVIIFTAAVWLNTTHHRGYPLLELLISLTLAVVLARRMVSVLFTALQWYSFMQREADRLLEESRDSRGDLKRTLDSLKAAYEAQQRMQNELIWARKQAEDAQRMKERFAANISHELRTPLNIILGFSEVMYLSPETYGEIPWSPTLRRDIYQIYRSSRYLLEMIDDILDLSRFEITGFSLNVEPTDLNTFMADTVEIASDLFRGHAAKFEVQLEPHLPELKIDRTRIRQCLLNLLNNAKRFTHAGRVCLEVRHEQDKVRLIVRDTGLGIPADKLPNIFDEFYQVDYSLSRQHGGAGLGLAITKRFVESHKGEISVESEEGVGSVFTISLPTTTTNAPTRPFHEVQVRPAAPCLLVIDPDQAVPGIIQRNLEGYDVIQVKTPGELSQAMQTYHPRMVIQNRPPETGRPQNFDIPFIECSLPSWAWIKDRLKVSACLSKPLTMPQLMSEIRLLGIAPPAEVLIIDHDRGFAQLIERMLQIQRITVRRAYDVMGSTAALRDQTPDLILLDLNLPENGSYRMLDVIHREFSDIPVMLLTASTYLENVGVTSANHLSVRWQGNNSSPAEMLSCLRAVVDALKT